MDIGDNLASVLRLLVMACAVVAVLYFSQRSARRKEELEAGREATRRGHEADNWNRVVGK